MVKKQTRELEKTLDDTQRQVALRDGGIGITGLEDMPLSMIPIPFVKLVQYTSRKTQLNDGSEAEPGEFLFSDTRTAESLIQFCLIKSRIDTVEFERNGEVIKSPTLKILGVHLKTKKLFILSLSTKSFAPFGRLMAQMKEKKISQAWEYEITVSSTKEENEKGKFFVALFNLGRKIDPEEIVYMSSVYNEYHNVFVKRDAEEPKEEVVETQEGLEVVSPEDVPF